MTRCKQQEHFWTTIAPCESKRNRFGLHAATGNHSPFEAEDFWNRIGFYLPYGLQAEGIWNLSRHLTHRPTSSRNTFGAHLLCWHQIRSTSRENRIFSSKTIPLGSKTIPLGSKTLPLGSKSVPLGSKSVPLGSKTLPLGSKSVPLGSKSVPLGSKSVPLQFQKCSALCAPIIATR